jgi:hypothetical protein
MSPNEKRKRIWSSPELEILDTRTPPACTRNPLSGRPSGAASGEEPSYNPITPAFRRRFPQRQKKRRPWTKTSRAEVPIRSEPVLEPLPFNNFDHTMPKKYTRTTTTISKTGEQKTVTETWEYA